MLPMDGVAQKRYGPHPKLGKTGTHAIPETGRFSKKTGRRLSTNGQSLRGIRDLDNFSKSNNREKTGR